MSRSLSYLRRGLLGVAVAGSLGFGAVEVLAKPQAVAPPPVCKSGQILCRCVSGQYFCLTDSGVGCPDPSFCLVQ